jgi:hypothetical protein
MERDAVILCWLFVFRCRAGDAYRYLLRHESQRTRQDSNLEPPQIISVCSAIQKIQPKTYQIDCTKFGTILDYGTLTVWLDQVDHAPKA